MDRVECHSIIGVSGVGISALAFCPEVTTSMAYDSIRENDASIRWMYPYSYMRGKERGIYELSVAVKHLNDINYDEARTGVYLSRFPMTVCT